MGTAKTVTAQLGGADVVLLGLAISGLFHYVSNTHVRWRHALQLLGHGVWANAGMLRAKMQHVVAERLVRHHGNVGVRVFVGGDPLGLGLRGQVGVDG